jgi:hypothetical protein
MDPAAQLPLLKDRKVIGVVDEDASEEPRRQHPIFCHVGIRPGASGDEE